MSGKRISEKYCFNCGWRLHEDEIKDDCIRQYCESCIRTIKERATENDVERIRLEENEKQTTIKKTS